MTISRLTEILTLSNTQIAIEAAATLAFALSGLIEAARKRLDVVGICMVMGLTAFGGGTLRDILLDRRPFFWVQHAGWLWVLLALCIAAMVFMRARHFEPTERALQWPDALGLGLFTAGGTSSAIVDRLAQETSRAVRSPDLKDRMSAEGLQPVGNTPAEFSAYLRAEMTKWAKVVKAANIKPQQ